MKFEIGNAVEGISYWYDGFTHKTGEVIKGEISAIMQPPLWQKTYYFVNNTRGKCLFEEDELKLIKPNLTLTQLAGLTTAEATSALHYFNDLFALPFKHESNVDISKLKDGDVIGVSKKSYNIVTTGIKFLTGSDFNHVGILVNEEGEWYVIEALMSSGITKRPLSVYLDSNKYDLAIKRPERYAFENEEQYQASKKIAIERAENDIGKEYDRWQIIGLAIKYIFKPIGRKLSWSKKNTLFNSKDKLICSEALSNWYLNTSPKYPHLFIGENDFNATPQTTSPKDVMKAKTMRFIAGNPELK